LADLRPRLEPGTAVEVVRFEPGPARMDLGLFGLLSDLLREADPDAVPIPLLLPAVSDARHLARLGIQTYGYLPMPLPPDLPFLRLIHAADERVPVDALRFGADRLYELLRRYPGERR
jgi:acetylornithine deacetylase/succinyl-diaminopimelate desuccinylase-like protein